MSPTGPLWQVGELATAAGVTVRTLHHWDQLGLVSPSRRGPNGYRLYDADDVRRLYQVLALRGLGLPLAQIGQALDGGMDLVALMRRQLDALERELAETAALRDRLAELVAHVDAGADPQAGDLLRLMEHMAMVERYYTPEQLDELAERRARLGPEAMEQAQRDWAALIAEAEKAQAEGVDPSDPRAQDLARRWHGLVEAFTGGNPGIRANLQRLYDEQGPEHASRGMVAPGLMAYMQAAIEAAGLA